MITNDLSKERPQWILSAYGPGRDAPLQLFGGHPREQSFEELRVRHYELAAQGIQQQAIQEAQALVNSAEQQIQSVLNDVDGAVKYMINGENEHPNRLDVCKARGVTPVEPPMSTPNQQTTSTFGQPSAPSTFGAPSVTSFGQPSAHTSAFGQPSVPTSTFGQPSQPSTFGQASALGRPTTSFGQPSSTFGKSSSPVPKSGQPSAPGLFGASQQQQTDRYGRVLRPDPLPQPSAAAKNPFAQSLAPTNASRFGNLSAPMQANAFGRSPTPNPPLTFGQAAPSAATTGFAQVSTAHPNPFAQPAAPLTGSFGQPSSAAPNPFNQRRTSSANQPVPAFGQASGPSNTTQPPTGPAGGRTTIGSTSGQEKKSVQIQKDSEDKVTSWKGMPVRYFDDEPCYKSNDGNWQRIWFPDGPPVFTKTVDLPDEAYDEATKENYKHLGQTGTFKDGVMPALPPRREWCSWNF